jgi:hypothetical protein
MPAEAEEPAHLLRIMLAMPARGAIAVPNVQSLVTLTQDIAQSDAPFALATYDCSDQIVSRNRPMSRFLTDTAFIHILWLDSDLVFAP